MYEWGTTENAVADTLVARGVPAEVEDTGGHCLAVRARTPGGLAVVWNNQGPDETHISVFDPGAVPGDENLWYLENTVATVYTTDDDVAATVDEFVRLFEQN